MSEHAGPVPTRVRDRASLAAELTALRVRAARGSGRPSVSLAEITRRVGLPPTSKSTVHSYVSGRTLAPAETLDAIVIALGATPEEQRAWAEAWFRVAAAPRAPSPRAPREVARLGLSRLMAAGVAATLILIAIGVAADGPVAAAPPPTGTDSTGTDYPHRPEFLAKLVNQATGKCLSRNGAFSHPGESERVGEHIYQWDCPGSDNPGHRVVLAPLGKDWQIRSSSRADLCLAADGGPGVDQRFQRCRVDDARQRWRLWTRAASAVAIENAHTGLCLGHQGGDPAVHIRILQHACTPGAETGWLIEDYPALDDQQCERSMARLRNHETGRWLAGAERPALSDDGVPIAFAPAGPTAHGCAVHVERSDARCLTASRDLVRWLSCARRPDQRWIVAPLGEEWVRLHTGVDVSRCLHATGPRLAPCGDEWLQQWQLAP